MRCEQSLQQWPSANAPFLQRTARGGHTTERVFSDWARLGSCPVLERRKKCPRKRGCLKQRLSLALPAQEPMVIPDGQAPPSSANLEKSSLRPWKDGKRMTSPHGLVENTPYPVKCSFALAEQDLYLSGQAGGSGGGGGSRMGVRMEGLPICSSAAATASGKTAGDGGALSHVAVSNYCIFVSCSC